MKFYLEILSKERFHEFRKSDTLRISPENYSKVAPKLKALFTKMNGGKWAKTVVFDFKTLTVEALNHDDRSLITALLELGYTVDKLSYQAGKAFKDGKEVKIWNILSSMESKIKTKEKMKEVYEKTKNETIKKQVEFIEKLNVIGLIGRDFTINTSKLSIFDDKNQKIVFTMDLRAIASQSTDVGWQSCMNLESGINRRYVGSGISKGVFIAYLANKGDEYELKSPLARVLLKPFESEEEKIFWQPDITYPKEATQKLRNSFQKQVLDIINKYQEDVPEGEYELKSDVYRDEMDRTQYRVTTKEGMAKLAPHIQLAVVRNNPELIKLLTNHNVLKDLFERDWDRFINVENKTHEMLKAAVSVHGSYIQEIPNPSEDLLIAAAGSDDGEGLQYIAAKDQSDAVITAALKREPYNIFSVKNPTKELWKEVFETHGRNSQLYYVIKTLYETGKIDIIDEAMWENASIYYKNMQFIPKERLTPAMLFRAANNDADVFDFPNIDINILSKEQIISLLQTTHDVVSHIHERNDFAEIVDEIIKKSDNKFTILSDVLITKDLYEKVLKKYLPKTPEQKEQDRKPTEKRTLYRFLFEMNAFNFTRDALQELFKDYPEYMTQLGRKYESMGGTVTTEQIQKAILAGGDWEKAVRSYPMALLDEKFVLAFIDVKSKTMPSNLLDITLMDLSNHLRAEGAFTKNICEKIADLNINCITRFTHSFITTKMINKAFKADPDIVSELPLGTHKKISTDMIFKCLTHYAPDVGVFRTTLKKRIRRNPSVFNNMWEEFYKINSQGAKEIVFSMFRHGIISKSFAKIVVKYVEISENMILQYPRKVERILYSKEVREIADEHQK